MKLFSNKSVLVTGAAQGIGYEICRQFALEGARVLLNDYDADLASTACDRLNQALGAPLVEAGVCDISDLAALQKMIKDFSQKTKGLDILIANAGITNYGPFLEYEEAMFDRLMQVNLKGTYFSAKYAAQSMIDCKISGRIVLMGSVTGLLAHQHLSAYGMTKAGIHMLAKSLALELGPHQICVNAIVPGATLTERTQAYPNYEANWQTLIPNQRVARTEDIARTALFLASPHARHINGVSIPIDGGVTIKALIPEEGA